MARLNYEFTSESVSEGHPDKVCDRISDEIVDLFFREGARQDIDPYAIRVACETLATTNRVIVAGEVRGPKLSHEKIESTVRGAIKDIGYEQGGFHWRDVEVEVLLHAQSADIAQGVDASGNRDEGAGDQGIMFGYACDETPELMPAPLYYAHRLVERQAQLRQDGRLPFLRPDAKSQVTMRYVDGRPHSVDTVVLSSQHAPEMSLGSSMKPEFVEAVVEEIIKPVLPKEWLKDTRYLVNPTGRFVVGGPQGDCGLTGRKIIVDTYGGACPHGGGA